MIQAATIEQTTAGAGVPRVGGAGVDGRELSALGVDGGSPAGRAPADPQTREAAAMAARSGAAAGAIAGSDASDRPWRVPVSCISRSTDTYPVTCGNSSVNKPCGMSFETYSDGTSVGAVYVRHGKRRLDDNAGISKYQELSQEEKDAQNEDRATRAARKSMCGKIRRHNLRRLTTFTNGGVDGGFPTLAEARRSWMRWYIADGLRLLGLIPLVVVPERGEKFKRIHLHAALPMNGYIDYAAIIRSWSAHLEAEGYHSSHMVTRHGESFACHRFHSGDEHGDHKRGFSSARICARYMSKYLTKGFTSEPRAKNERRFDSRNCDKGEVSRVVGFRLSEALDIIGGYFGTGVVPWPFYDDDGELAGYTFDTGEVKRRCGASKSGN